MNFIEIENKHYILASSALADQKTFLPRYPSEKGQVFALTIVGRKQVSRQTVIYIADPVYMRQRFSLAQ